MLRNKTIVYIIKNEKTSKYWSGIKGIWYTDNMQEARTYTERNDFRLKKLKKYEKVVMVEVENILKKIN